MYFQLLHFNSIKVRLKLRCLSSRTCSNRHFNSIKVRLKHAEQSIITVIIIFQFHKGTIKTDLSHRHMFTAQIFQFHKGTIKTGGCATEIYVASEFQFHKGTIKTVLQFKFTKPFHYFNSIKVRLKPSPTTTPKPPLLNFNSIKVRLKHS